MNDKRWIIELIIGVIFAPLVGFLYSQFAEMKTELDHVSITLSKITTNDGDALRLSKDYFDLKTEIEVIKNDTTMIKDDLKELSAMVMKRINSI